VFGAGDAWLSTGDLFRRDADGDHWRLDSARDLILTPRGPVYAGTVRDALGDLPAWYLDRGGERYRPLTATARRRLASAK
jgi:acyl-CoA synthetase (AMP-forming)/AMP-acid ligase II